MKISDQNIRPVTFVGGSTQSLTFVRPAERPDKADPPLTSKPTEAIPPRGTHDQILTKDEAQQMQMAAQQRNSNQGLRVSGQHTSAIQNIVATIRQKQLQGNLDSAQTQRGLHSAQTSNVVTPDPESRETIEKAMRFYNPGDSSADRIAEQIAARPYLLQELTTSEREKLVMGLFDGPTSESEEDAAMKILLSANDQDLKKVVDAIGWERLTDELDPEDIEQLSGRYANTDTDGSDPAIQFEKARVMSNFKERSKSLIGADDAALEISKRKDLIKHLNVEDRISLIDGLFRGTTNEEEEDAAMELLFSANDKDLQKIVGTIGWQRLKDELDPQDYRKLSLRLKDPEAWRVE